MPTMSTSDDQTEQRRGGRARRQRGDGARKGNRQLPRSEHSKLYSHLTPAYEMLFPLLVRKRIWSAIEQLQLTAGSEVLEVGVGTGASLPAYPSDVRVTGIDLSAEMLAVAEKKIQQQQWSHIEVGRGNAEELDFADASFDCVTSFHTISVVSRPDRMMEEIVRVLRPGGQVLVINHFRSPRPWLANMIDQADPLTRRFGWRTDLDCQSVVEGLPLRVEQRYKTSAASLFTVLRATRL
jgi:phosphatidylethanolamine/phosphatidyl-N-methylethanolamine N-methyltransferase